LVGKKDIVVLILVATSEKNQKSNRKKQRKKIPMENPWAKNRYYTAVRNSQIGMWGRLENKL
jgi:hypothetical protein